MKRVPPAGPRFRPTTPGGWARLAFSGWTLINEAVRELSHADPSAEPRSRGARQTYWSRRLLAHLAVKLEVDGAEHFGRGPYVVACLHESVVDPLCLLALGAGPMRMVARSELFAWPGVGEVLRRNAHFAIDPEAGARDWRGLVRAARAAIDAGEHIVMFPQGSVLGIETAFRPGAFRLATLLGVPLLPVALWGSHRVWEHPFTARLRYGQSVALTVLPAVAPESLRDVGGSAWRPLERRLKALALADPRVRPRHYVPARDGWWDGYAWEIDPDFPDLHSQVAAHRATVARASAVERVRAAAECMRGEQIRPRSPS